MRDFFKGWRRKAGCTALLMALIVTGAWMRSLLIGRQSQQVRMGSGPFPGQEQLRFSIGTKSHVITSDNGELTWEVWDWNDRQFSRWSICYWWFAIPLTLSSGYLILWKPRKKPDDSSFSLPLALPFTLLSAYVILWKPPAKSEDAPSLPQSPIPNP